MQKVLFVSSLLTRVTSLQQFSVVLSYISTIAGTVTFASWDAALTILDTNYGASFRIRYFLM